MLINLSNHPSEKWSEKQRTIALGEFNNIEDIPFPQIPPEATRDEVSMLAENYYLKIRKIASKNVAAVHLMGEMTFTYMLVNKLREVGIPCVASTTNRTVEEKDGKKIVQFNFVQFRPYF